MSVHMGSTDGDIITNPKNYLKTLIKAKIKKSDDKIDIDKYRWSVCVASPIDRGGYLEMARVCAIICHLFCIVFDCNLYVLLAAPNCFIRIKVPYYFKVDLWTKTNARAHQPSVQTAEGEIETKPEGGDRTKWPTNHHPTSPALLPQILIWL